MTAALRRAACVAAIAALAIAAGCVLPAAARAAELGVYQGAGYDGVKRLDTFTEWLGGKPDRAIDFFAQNTWESMVSSAAWSATCWKKTGLPMTFSVPMLTQSPGATLAKGAAGEYDQHYRTIARYLVNNGHAAAVIRLGWEFNADWYPWRAAADPASWVAYWKRIVDAMREVPGQRFRFEWCPILGIQAIRADKLYPGDDYVDLIGLDTYNDSWTPGVTPEQRWKTLMDQPYGLKWHRDFAAQHGKPATFPEWGTGLRPTGQGGGDDPYFIRQMAKWIAAGDVAYHVYWDYPAADYNARLSDGHQPRAAAAFLERYGRGGATR